MSVVSTPSPPSLRASAGGSGERVLSHLLAGAGFMPVWVFTGVLFVVAAVVAPETLSANSLSAVLPLMSVLALAGLGQMLVIMVGGIDLSIPGTMTLTAYLVAGVSGGSNGGLAGAVVVCLLVAAVIGLVNGLLVSVGGLNALIVTLAAGQIVLGVTTSYSNGLAAESAVPSDLSRLATSRVLGASWIFWIALAITVVVALSLRHLALGRRFQVAGANPRAAWMNGIRVRAHVAFAYVGASVLYATAGLLLAGLINNPSLDIGSPYLLGPIAAVVIGGASLAGGFASATSTWAAAFALTFLGQMLRVLGLSTALQYVVFGGAIAAGMVVSGDRIVGLLGAATRRNEQESRKGGAGTHPGTAGGEARTSRPRAEPP